jgi:chloride channel protein, CIC family
METRAPIPDRVTVSARRWGNRLAVAGVVGVLAGLAAAGLEWLIEEGSVRLVGRFTHVSGAGVIHFDWGVLLLPAVGGLIAGLAVQLLARDEKGHGVDQLTRAFHRGLGRMPFRDPAVKTAATGLVISFGGSVGPEGPIAAMGSAIGTAVSRLWRLSPRETRVLLLAGCAAGIGAIFRCPLGGALFATSIIYREPEFESNAIVSSFVASVIGYSTYVVLWGADRPLLAGVDALNYDTPWDLVWYAALGPLCGLVAIGFSLSLRVVEKKLVPASKLPRWATAALGGLVTGALACLLPQVMDGRYGFLEGALNGSLFADAGRSWALWAGLLSLLVVAKVIATAATIGGGSPGGVLGPSVFIGGVVGAALGALGMAMFPESFSEPLRQSLIPVGMAGVLSATMRTPLAAVVIVAEMTGSYGLIAPLMLVCVTSYVIGRRWGLNEEQVPTAADSPVHAADPILHLLDSVKVGSIMQTDWPLAVSPDTPLGEIVSQTEPGTRPVVAVVEDGRLIGLVTASDLGAILASSGLPEFLVAEDAMTTRLVTLYPDEALYAALDMFDRSEHEVLPVVGRGRDRAWLGMLSRAQVASSLRTAMERVGQAVASEHAGLKALQTDVRVEQLLLTMPAHDVKIQRLFVPIDAVGKTLRECGFRRRYNADVIAIEEPDGSIKCPPPIDTALKTEQRLLAVVHRIHDTAG